MSNEREGPQPGQKRVAEVAQEIFSRERGANRDMPFSAFLAKVQEETREQVKDERREQSQS